MIQAHPAPRRRTLEGDIRRYMVGRAALAAAGFVSIPLMTRGVGVENYGQISLWTTLSSWVPQIVAGWLQQSALRYHGLYSALDSARSYRRTLHAAAALLSLLVTFLTGLMLTVLLRVSWAESALTALLAGVTVLHMAFSAVAQAELRPSAVVAADLLRTVLPIALFAGHFTLHSGHIVPRATVLLYFLIGMAASAAFLAGRAEFNVSSDAKPSREIAKRMFRFGLPMGIWFGLCTGQMLIGRMFLQRFHLTSALGLFTTYQDFFAKTGTVLFMPVTYALHGQVMALWADGAAEESGAAIRRAYLYQALIGAVLAVCAIAAHPTLSKVLLGAAPSSETRLEAIVLIVGVLAGNFGLIAHKGMEIMERTGRMAAYMGIALAANAALCLCLVRAYSGLGVGIALLAANLLYLAAAQLDSARGMRGARWPEVGLTAPGDTAR